RSPWIPTSARNHGAPVPSTTRPPAITRSNVPALGALEGAPGTTGAGEVAGAPHASAAARARRATANAERLTAPAYRTRGARRSREAALRRSRALWRRSRLPHTVDSRYLRSDER